MIMIRIVRMIDATVYGFIRKKKITIVPIRRDAV